MKTWHFAEMGTGDNGYRLYARVTLTGIEYPWIGMRKAQRQAKENGRTAVFYSSVDTARAEGKIKGDDCLA
jgi:hypothetical protein